MLPVVWRRTKQKLFKLVSLTVLPIVVGIVLSHFIDSPVSASDPVPDSQEAIVALADIPLAGGETTTFIRSSHAYEQPSANLSEELIDLHTEGDVAFEAVFVTAPATVNPGLGPHFNNTTCAGCHIRNGRGLPAQGQLLVRVSQDEAIAGSPTTTTHYQAEPTAPGDNTPPVPGLGTQIQDRGIYGAPPEATVELEWIESMGQYEDGTSYSLRSPKAHIRLADGSPLPDTVKTSLRLPPPVFGLGLLEAVSEGDILAMADPEDLDGNGISGRPNTVWDVRKQSTSLGRFGLKANQPNLLQQSAAAYLGDMGVTSPMFPSADGSSDIDADTLKTATFYVQSLAVPARTLLNDPVVQRGEQLFDRAQCTACHIPTLRTSTHPEYTELSNQTIHPYTDLLLHDMGAGLADNRPDFEATGSEWRTPPLWGIGVTQTVLPYAKYLHDGRAHTLEEAILWHGGEAEQAKQAFREMPEGDRQAIVRFLRTL